MLDAPDTDSCKIARQHFYFRLRCVLTRVLHNKVDRAAN